MASRLLGAEHLVAPADIEYTIWQYELVALLGSKPVPGVLPGDWDLLKSRFEDSHLFQSFRQRYTLNVAWRETEYYKILADGFLNKRVRQAGGVDHLLARYDRIYDDIQRNGYRSAKASKPILLHIGRCGCLIRHDGSHRLAIAKILKLPSVSVRYHLIHADYIAMATGQPADGDMTSGSGAVVADG